MSRPSETSRIMEVLNHLGDTSIYTGDFTLNVKKPQIT